MKSKTKKKYFYYTPVLALIIFAVIFWHVYAEYYTQPQTNLLETVTPQIKNVPEHTEEEEALPQQANLDVPYINEAPEDIWTGSWKNACEEAVIAMADKYHAGVKSVSIPEAKVYLQNLFNIQQREYGSDANSDAVRTLEIIENHAGFGAKLVTNPTIEDIKAELVAGRPVLGFHRGFDLKNKNIPFLATGSSYHTTVIKGYNDEKGIFITHDPGDSKEGADHAYEYNLFMKSLHDYDYKTALANGPARVLFTFKK
jgi:hypothetical protein